LANRETEDLEPVPLPAALLTSPAFGFVGRADEWRALSEAWSAVQAGGRRFVMLGGEAGAGKTRLAIEFAHECHAAGAIVLFGGCDNELALPYQPFVQVLDHVLGAAPEQMLAAQVGVELDALSVLVPGLDGLAPDSHHASSQDPEADRYRLFSAYAKMLGAVGRSAPVVLVLDDLHWAGAQTLGLLRFLARSGAADRLLVIGTFRDTGDEVTEPLASCLADLRRLDVVTGVHIGELDTVSIEQLVARATGQDLDPDLRRVVSTVAERSAGNAFYVCEMWRHLVTIGVVTNIDGHWSVRSSTEPAGVPASVKEVVRARLARLSPRARTLLELAAVAGSRVEARVLDLASDLSAADVGAGLDELVDAGLLTEVGEILLGYQFSHILVRETVESTVAPMARSQLHFRIAGALELAYEPDRRAVLAELTRHFAAAASVGGGPKAVYYGRRAAQQAVRSVAYDEAFSHFETALGLAPGDSSERIELLLELAELQLRNNISLASLEVCREAFEAACALGDGELAARAAVGFEQAVHFPGLPGDWAVEVVSKAMTMLGPAESPLRTRLQASLARAYAFAGRAQESLEAVELALTLARRSNDAEAQCAALEAALVSTSDPYRLLNLSEELYAVDSDDPWHVLYATTNQMRALVTLGRFDEAASVMARHWKAAERYPTFQFVGHAFEAALLLAAGRFDDAEAAAERAHELGLATNSPFDEGVFGLQMFAIRREQGRLAEVEPALRLVTSLGSDQPLWRPGLAVLYTDLGLLDDARREFEALAEDGFAATPRDSVWPACLSFLADACVVLEDIRRAEVLCAELAQFRNQNLMVGMTIAFGPADRFLGKLTALLGRLEDAQHHYDVAMELAERSRSPVWQAHVLHDNARLLEIVGDHARAAELGGRARDIALSLGMRSIAALPVPGDLRARTDETAAVLPGGLSAREAEVLVLVAAGRSNRQIGEELHISQHTVANHVRAILQKTMCANRAEAAAYAIREGLLD
jgi:DNA-binding CsgD family transcriptional regulator/tetratricopeptide (TPR) repeat protein